MSDLGLFHHVEHQQHLVAATASYRPQFVNQLLRKVDSPRFDVILKLVPEALKVVVLDDKLFRDVELGIRSMNQRVDFVLAADQGNHLLVKNQSPQLEEE